MPKNVWFAFILLCGLTSISKAKELPTATDLKAAYCLKATQNNIAIFSNYVNSALTPEIKSDVQETLKKFAEDETRIRSYLMPRLESLELDPVLIAVDRARSDIEDSEAKINVCIAAYSAECKQANTAEKHAECQQRCMDEDEAGKRIRSCAGQSWLPFN